MYQTQNPQSNAGFGHTIFVQANDRIEDGLSIHEKRFKTQFTEESDEEINEKPINYGWMSVRLVKCSLI